MADPIDQYESRFPEELASGIEGLDNPTKRAIFVLLYDNPGLSFTEIRNELSGDKVMPSQTLSSALDGLKMAGLVNKQVRGADDDSRFTSAYSVSTFGEQFFKSLLGGLGVGEGGYMSGGIRFFGDTAEEMRIETAR